MNKVRLLLAFCLVVLSGAVGGCGGTTRTAPATYLAVGDSYAAGYTTAAAATPSFGFPGYVLPYAGWLAAKNPRLGVVNLAIPGETSETFFSTGSTGAPFNRHYSLVLAPGGYPTNAVSQADLIVSRIRQEHEAGRSVYRITVQLGGNDLLALVVDPGFLAADEATRQQRLTETLAGTRSRYREVLRILRAAAPEAVILAVGYTNPFPPLGPLFPAQGFAVEAVPALNAVIAAESAAAGAIYVDIYERFLGHEAEWTFITSGVPTPGPTPGTEAPNVHPNDAGYAAIAELLQAADPG